VPVSTGSFEPLRQRRGERCTPMCTPNSPASYIVDDTVRIGRASLSTNDAIDNEKRRVGRCCVLERVCQKFCRDMFHCSRKNSNCALLFDAQNVNALCRSGFAHRKIIGRIVGQ
jgi:hypothetical protein